MNRTGKEHNAEAEAGEGPKAEARSGDRAAVAVAGGATSTEQNVHRAEPPAQGGNVTAMEASGIEFTSQSTFAMVPGVKTIEVDADTILVDVLKDKYVRLNSTGTFILRLMIEGRPFEEISEQVAQHFSIDAERASEETSSFLKELIRAGMAVQQGEQRFSQRRTDT